MREAAGALALDPALAGAAELVGRLMLEPPRVTPPEVKQALAADDVRNAKAVARAGLFAVLGAMIFLPLLYWIAPPSSPYVPLLFALLSSMAPSRCTRSARASPGPGSSCSRTPRS